MDKIEVLSDKQMPNGRRPGAKPKYPWTTMKSGEAFKFPDQIQWSTATSMASKRGYDFAIKFVVRREPDGIYCYRVDGLPEGQNNANFREELLAVVREPGPATQAVEAGYGAASEGESDDEI